MFIGEGPGQEEDRQGRPFVGRSGELLTRMIQAIGMERTEVYICNVVKCRPPKNRNPEPDEAAACLNYLRAQVALVRPKVVVLLGKVACQYTLNEQVFITRDHGRWYERKGVWFMPTFHPSALLRDPAKKRDAWEDFQKIRDKLKELIRGDMSMERFRAELRAFVDGIYEGEKKVLVFGEGSRGARVALVGEAPGEQETLQGRPFVGKAGKNLDEFLELAKLDRAALYVTNTVKFRPTKLSRGPGGEPPAHPGGDQAVSALAFEGDRAGGPGLRHHPGQRAAEGAHGPEGGHRRPARRVYRRGTGGALSHVPPRVPDLQPRAEGGLPATISCASANGCGKTSVKT